MDSDKTLLFQFSSAVLFDPEIANGYMKHYVPVPETVGIALEQAGHSHVEGKINHSSFRRVIHTRVDGSYCLKFGMTWLNQVGLKVNDPVDVELRPDLQPDRIDMPLELLIELQREPAVMEAFSALALGQQKTLAYWVAQAKKSETRVNRAKKIVQDLTL
ncbi:MAG: YdeI/OmpD-associated family protein [Phototrophicaceae bacterium]